MTAKLNENNELVKKNSNNRQKTGVDTAASVFPRLILR
jgi:hypothetical protein